MCGIVGRLNFDRSPVDARELTFARESLTNRGPDDAGTWIAGPVGLAHRRLAILDLSPRGKQPMLAASGRLAISYNGEIFNFRELRAELASLGHTFSSESDTEVILAAYRQWGIDCVRRLNGMFAFGLWDTESQTLHLARDRIGVKPLYVAHDGNKVVFASTVRALTRFPDIRRTLNPEALSLYLQMSYVPAPHSIYRDIRKLMPGTCLSIDINGKASTHAYWTLAPASRARENLTEQVAVEKIEALLLSSVKYRLLSDVPVGAFLSGGVDSALLVALMRKLSDKVRTFTIGFEDPAHDESSHARAISRHLGTEHTDVLVTLPELQELARTLPTHYDEPFADVSAIPTLALARLTRQSVTVAISGDGGDELFCGYPYYRYMQQIDPLRRLSAPLRPVLGAFSRALPHRFAMVLRGLAQASTHDLFAYMRGPLKTRDYRWLAPGIVANAGAFLGGVAARAAGDGDVAAHMDLDLQTYLPDDILTKVDRATMAFGLEARTPYLDYRVVEQVRALPAALRAQPGKPLLRAVLARHLPRELFERPKHGFTVPIRAWLRAGMRGALTDAVEHGELVSSGFVDRTAARSLLEEHVSGRHNHENMLWALLCFEQWYSHNHDNAPHPV